MASMQLVTAQARASAMPPLDHDCQSSSAGTQSGPTTITLRITRGVGTCSIIWNYGAGTTPGEVEVLLGGSAWNLGNSQTVSGDSPSIVTITNTAGTSTERVVFTYTRSVTPSVMWTYVLIGGGGASASVPNDIVIPPGPPSPCVRAVCRRGGCRVRLRHRPKGWLAARMGALGESPAHRRCTVGLGMHPHPRQPWVWLEHREPVGPMDECARR